MIFHDPQFLLYLFPVKHVEDRQILINLEIHCNAGSDSHNTLAG